MVVDPGRRITRVNPAFTRITGYASEDVIGKTPRVLSSGLHGPEFYRQIWACIERDGFWHGEIWNRRKTGEDRKSTRLNSSHLVISYAVFCLKKKIQHCRQHVSLTT